MNKLADMHLVRTLFLFVPFLALCNNGRFQKPDAPPKTIIINNCENKNYKKIGDTLFLSGLAIGDTLKINLETFQGGGYGWDLGPSETKSQNILKTLNPKPKITDSNNGSRMYNYIFLIQSQNAFTLHFVKRRTENPIAECYLKFEHRER